jgi:hypothetical protein
VEVGLARAFVIKEGRSRLSAFHCKPLIER